MQRLTGVQRSERPPSPLNVEFRARGGVLWFSWGLDSTRRTQGKGISLHNWNVGQPLLSLHKSLLS